MPFQQTVRIEQTAFFVGNIVKDGPIRSNALILNTTDPTLNVVGSGFSYIAGNDNEVEAGGTGIFAGVLVGPKQYSSAGTTADPLAPTLTLPNGENGDILYMGIVSIIYGVNTDNATGAVNIGDQLVMEQTTGIISAIAPGATAPAGFTLIPNGVATGYNLPASGLGQINLLGGQ